LHALTTYELRDYRRQLEQAITYFDQQQPVPPVRAVIRARLDAVTAEQDDRARIAVPDTGRPPDVSTLTPGELERTRRDLAAALALARPGSPARAPIGTHLAAIDAELATRACQRSPLPPPGPDVEEVRGQLEHTRHLRMALDRLQERLPAAYACDGLESELWALREKIDTAELAQLRAVGDGAEGDGGLVVDGDEQGGVGADQGGVL
jgi:hypothetical protein